MPTETFAILIATSILGGWVIGIAAAELGSRLSAWRHRRRMQRLERETQERLDREQAEFREFLDRVYGEGCSTVQHHNGRRTIHRRRSRDERYCGKA